MRVAWFILEDFAVLLRRHRADDTVSKAIARVPQADVVVADDIGLLPVAKDAAEVSTALSTPPMTRSVAIGSNLHATAFDELDAARSSDCHRRAPAAAPRPRLPSRIADWYGCPKPSPVPASSPWPANDEPATEPPARCPWGSPSTKPRLRTHATSTNAAALTAAVAMKSRRHPRWREVVVHRRAGPAVQAAFL
jgi:hypothetical protein